MTISPKQLAAPLAVLALSSPAAAQQRYAAVVDHVLAAFTTADVVCLGEGHGRHFDNELRIAVVRHPDFPRVAHTVVVEMANPVHQDLLDRFILEGAALSREQLAPVWRDATNPEVWESPIYEQFLRAIREVNLKLPRDQRIRVLGGDSKVDWSNIKRPEELIPYMNRGGNIREIIAEQVLDKGLKALAIYGSGHCARVGMGFPGDLAARYARTRFWSIFPIGNASKARAMFGLGDSPTYITVKGSAWESTPGTDFLPPPLNVRPVGAIADAMVYHGRPDSVVATDLDTFRAQYGPELDRRAKILADAVKLQQQQRKP